MAVSGLSAETLDLKTCLALSQRMSLSLKSADLDLRLAESGLKSAGAPFYPFLSAQGSEILFGDSFSGKRIEDPLLWGSDTTQASLVASLNLFHSGKDWLALSSAREQLRRAREIWKRAAQDLAMDSLRSYFETLKERKLLALAERSLAQRQDRLEVAKTLYQNGSRSYVDLLNSEVQVQTAQRSLSNQRTRLLQSESRLNSMLGKTPGAEIELVDSLANTRSAPDEEKSLSLASKFRSDLKAAHSELEIQEDSLDLAWLNRLPTLSLDMSFSKDLEKYRQDPSLRTHPGRGDENSTWAATASLSIPLFQGFALSAATDRARAQRDKARLALELAERQLKLELRERCLDLAQSLENMKLDESLVEAAKKNLTEVQRGYAQGTASLFEVNQADTDHLQAVTQQLNSAYDYQVNLAQWKLATGLDLMSAEEE